MGSQGRNPGNEVSDARKGQIIQGFLDHREDFGFRTHKTTGRC